MISKNFLKSSFIYSFVGMLPLASGVLLIPFYGNTNLLSTSDFGQLAIFIGLSELVAILLSFAAGAYLGVNYIHYQNDKEKEKRFIGTTLLFLLVFGVIGTGLLIFGGRSFFSFAFNNDSFNFYPYGMLSVVTGFFNGVFRAFTTFLIYKQKPSVFFWSNIIHFLLTISVSVGGLYLYPMSLTGPINGRLISAFVTFVWALVYLGADSKFRYSKEIFHELIKYSFPIYLYQVLNWIVSNVDRYIILGMLRTEDVAVFDFAIKLTMVVELLQNGLSAAINPKVFAIWKANNDLPIGSVTVNKYFNGFSLLNQLSIPIFYLIIPFVVPVLINNSELYVAITLLPVLMAGMVVRIWFVYLIAPIYYFKKTTVFPIVFFIVAVIQIASTYLFIDLFKLEGATWANFITKCVQVFLLFLFVRRFYSFAINPIKMFVYPIFYIGLLLASNLFFEDVNIYLMNAVHFGLLFLSGIIIFRKEISEFLIRQKLNK